MRDRAVSPLLLSLAALVVASLLFGAGFLFAKNFEYTPTPARSIAVASSGMAYADSVVYVVTNASHDLRWGEIMIHLGDVILSYANPPQEGSWCILSANTCGDLPSGFVRKGDAMRLQRSGIRGQELNIIDTPAHSVILTLQIR